MGGCVSVSFSCDEMANQFSQWLCLKGSYIRKLPENLQSLGNAIEMLRAKRDDVQRRVDREESTGNQRMLAQVQVWLTKVLEIENQYSVLISTSDFELERLRLRGFCSKNVKRSYRYGKRIAMMLIEVDILSSQGEFDVVVVIYVPAVVVIPIQPTIVGQETMLEIVWNDLMEEGVGIVGLYGMGGVGKTTLLTQINNKFTEITSKFDIVIWVVISKGASVYKIQGDIGQKLGLSGEEWNQKNENQRALDIYNVLRKKKFVLLLDDIWEKVNLETIGVPYPTKKNGSKVALTTRSLEVCGLMGVHQPIQVNCLDPEKAWELFQTKVGIQTLESHPDIPKLARKVAEKCHGLPLALNVIGETMVFKTSVQEWQVTIKDLNTCIADFPDIENKVLPILKYSYDNLRGEKVKSCFLYCSLFPEDYYIKKESLIDYWIGEGFIDENEGREMALNRGHEIVGTLIRACLLWEHNYVWIGASNGLGSILFMHDVVREMALWIATDFGKNKDKWIVQAGVGLREVPKIKNCKDVRKISLMKNVIENIIDSPECPQLTTLLLQENRRLENLCGKFFRSLTRLLVLDLSDNGDITELPNEISNLVSLRYLDLSRTKIEQLPIGLQELKMLIHLNLESTRELESLHGISKLSSLRTFRLQYSKVMLDMNLMKDLEVLEHLEYVTANIPSKLVAEPLLYDSRVWRCINDFHIMEEFGKESVRRLVLSPAMINPHCIQIESPGISEIEIKKASWNKSLTTPGFSNLSLVFMTSCYGLKDLTWLLFAPNLTCLNASCLSELEVIISKEKTEKEENRCTIIPFQKLEVLFLTCLPKLKSIYWTSLPFPCLNIIYIRDCPNLRKFPFDSQSIVKIERLRISYNYETWRSRIEWEDEATRHRFANCFDLSLEGGYVEYEEPPYNSLP